MQISTEYPEQVNLPFNFGLIRDNFSFRTPLDEDTGETGTWVIIQGGGVLAHHAGGGMQLPEGELPSGLTPKNTPLCIGSWQGKPVRVISILQNTVLPSVFSCEQFNAVVQNLDEDILTLAGLGKQILHWERQSRHCSRCGGTTSWIRRGTWGRACLSCRAEHFPHIHPCAIVLVRRGDEILLARKREWAPGRYGLVAGFLDFGESLEECAVREVKEEAGIDIRNVRYVASQNWPFPAQLMAGFVADYSGGEIAIDPGELEDARWFNTSSLPDLPAKRSIARWIIDTFAT